MSAAVTALLTVPPAEDERGADKRKAETKKSKRPAAKPNANAKRLGLATNASGATLSIIDNAVLILQGDPAWAGVLATNERSGQPVARKRLRDDEPATNYPRPLQDVDITALRRGIGSKHRVHFGKETMRDAVDAVAAASLFDPVQVYFKSLPKWDGRPRCDALWIDNAGAEDSKLVKAMSGKALIQAVARTFEPGCQADHMVVIEGLQGIGKNTALRALLPDPRWILDDLPKLDSDDTRRMIQEPLIVVLDELHALDRKQVEQVKAFITRRDDQWVEKWQKYRLHRPRRCVFFGTTNRQDWNHDPTGARRFWPIWCNASRIDVDTIANERDQLWAEALRRYKRGEKCWIEDAGLLRELATVQGDRRDVDDWFNLIEDAVRGREKIDPEWIYEALGIAKKDRTRQQGTRIKNVMIELGYRHIAIRLPGRAKNLKGYQKREGEACSE